MLSHFFIKKLFKGYLAALGAAPNYQAPRFARVL